MFSKFFKLYRGRQTNRWSWTAAAAVSTGSVLTLLIAWIGGAVAAEKVSTLPPDYRRPKIAIIGGGIGGTSSAFFLRKLFGETAEIDLYDIGEKIGGRIATVHIAGRDYECGASILHPKNKYMVQFVQDLGLSKRNKVSTTSGFYNGEEFVLIESKWSVITIGKILWRYGYDFIRLFRDVDAWMKKFDKIYDLQDEGQTFKTIEDLVETLGGEEFVNATREPLIPWLKGLGYSDRFIGEIVSAATRVNYGQDETMKAFAGMVSLAGIQPGLWAVQDGNYKVSEALFKESKANHRKSLVMSVERNSTSEPRDSFIIHSVPWQQNKTDLKKPKEQLEYDIVIVAIPQHGKPPSQHPINFAGFDPKSKVPKGPFPGDYRHTVANFVSGTVKASTFDFDKVDSLPDSIITVVEPKTRFRSLAKNFPVDITEEEAEGKDKYVYKVFSTEPLNKKQFVALFDEVLEETFKDWLAYPDYGTVDKLNEFPPFELNPGVYYVNGIEWAASAMEMSAIGGKNVALLAHQYWTGQRSNSSRETLDDKDEL